MRLCESASWFFFSETVRGRNASLGETVRGEETFGETVRGEMHPLVKQSVQNIALSIMHLC